MQPGTRDIALGITRVAGCNVWEKKTLQPGIKDMELGITRVAGCNVGKKKRCSRTILIRGGNN